MLKMDEIPTETRLQSEIAALKYKNERLSQEVIAYTKIGRFQKSINNSNFTDHVNIFSKLTAP